MAELTKEQLRQAAIANINKKYGKNSLINLGDGTVSEDIDCITTGILGLDLILGQSFPKGRISEIYGPESSGKTTLALHVAAKASQAGENVGFVDAEHALDLKYARALGVDVDNKFDLCQPDYGEQGLDILIEMVKSNAYGLLVVDSVAALTPKKEIDGEMDDQNMGLHARIMSKAMRKLTAEVSRSNTHVIFINQLRMKIGVMFGNPETTTGGNELKFYASQRIDVRKHISDNEKDADGEIVSNKVKIKIVKNKMAPPLRDIMLDIEYGKGFSKTGDLLDQGVKHGLILKSGAWFKLAGGDSNFAQGRSKAKAYLEENPEIMDSIYDSVVNVRNGGGEIPLDEDEAA